MVEDAGAGARTASSRSCLGIAPSCSTPRADPRLDSHIGPASSPRTEEFTERARTIVAATGKDERAALTMIDAFGDEVMENLNQVMERLKEAAHAANTSAAEASPLPIDPPTPHLSPGPDAPTA